VAEEVKYLNQGAIQDALGVSLNYTTGNSAVYYAFQQAGDWVLPHAFAALERVLEEGVRVIMYYGDADYICNWFGGEAVSLALNYTHAAQFKKAGYAPFNIDGIEYGAVREYGNFSFLRIYDCGHQVPFYQRKFAAQSRASEKGGF
jgi:carboxypeptidase C (cathepsin A)